MLEIESILKLLRRWIWFLALGAILGAAATFGILNAQGLYPQYETAATVTVGAQIDATTISQEELLMGQDLISNYVVLAERPPITTSVIEELGLSISTKELTSRKLEVAQQGQTRVLLIIGKDRDPVIAAAIANETANQLRESGPVRPNSLIQIIALAEPPSSASTEPYLMMALGGLAGMFLFATIAVVVELARDRPLTVGWAASRINIPILGTYQPGNLQANGVETQHAPVWWVVMETFERAVREQEGPDADGQEKVLVVSSSVRGEPRGKVAQELARAWAASGARVILADADLHQPTLRTGSDVAGLTTLVASADRNHDLVEKALVPSDSENLTLLESGPAPADFSSLLQEQPWREVTSMLASMADVVILISPAASVDPLAMVLAAEAGGVLLVLELGKTKAADANQASELLIKGGNTLLGAVVYSR